MRTAVVLGFLLAVAAAEAPTKQAHREPHVNSYVKHLMDLRKKTSSHSEPAVAVTATAPVVAKKPAAATVVAKKAAVESKPAPAKKADKPKTSMASISAKVVPVHQPDHASTTSYVAKLRAAKPAAHTEPAKAVQHKEPVKAAKHAEPVKGKVEKKSEPAKAQQPKKVELPRGKLGAAAAKASGLADVISNIDAAQATKVKKTEVEKAATKLHAVRKEPTTEEKKTMPAKLPEHKKAAKHTEPAKAAKHAEPAKSKAVQHKEPAKAVKHAELKKGKAEKKTEPAKPLGKLGATAAKASGLADVISNIDAAQAAKNKAKVTPNKATVEKVAAQLKTRKEPAKTVKKGQEPKKQQADTTKPAAVKAHDATKAAAPKLATQLGKDLATASAAKGLADVVSNIDAAQAAKPKEAKVAVTAKEPAPLPSANVQTALSSKTETAQGRDSPEIKKLPCQGFEGEGCRHVDTHTATGDWRGEYGPQPVRAGARASGAAVAFLAATAALLLGA